jgi:hypothetical protein
MRTIGRAESRSKGYLVTRHGLRATSPCKQHALSRDIELQQGSDGCPT